MCDTLIHQYKFGLDAIATIFSVAKKFGDPLAVLKAVEALGKLQAMEQELGKLDGKIAERQRLLQQLEGKYQEALGQVESLNAMVLRVGTEIGKLQSEISHGKGLEKMLTLINDPASADFNENGPLVVSIAASLRKWVMVNEKRFRSAYSIKSGLEALLKELGETC
jgi:hypothetical protein